MVDLSPKPLTQEMIDDAFEKAEHQADYLFALYRIAYPQWNEIEKVNGWPRISKVTATYIIEKAVAFDKKNHPNVQCGGLWINNGFGAEDEMEDWIVQPVDATLKS